MSEWRTVAWKVRNKNSVHEMPLWICEPDQNIHSLDEEHLNSSFYSSPWILVSTCKWLKGKIAHYLVEISRFKLWALRGSEREEAAWKTNTNAFQSSMKIHNFIHVELFLAFQQRLRHSNVGVSPGFVETLLSEKHSAKAFIHSKARRFSSSFPLTCAVMILL